MKQPFQINIDAPCHEKWESFKPTAQGGFCASCQKNVIDFSQMSESQLIAFFRDRSDSSGNLCGRFRENQLKKTYAIEEWFPTWSIQNDQLQYEIPVTVITSQKYKQAIILPLSQHKKAIRNLAAVILTMLCTEQGIGQNKVISGQIIDAESKEVLPGVSIVIKNTQRGAQSDINGNYTITVAENDTLLFRFIGYNQIEEKASGNKDFKKIKMEQAVMGLPELTLVEYACSTRRMGTGGVSVVAVSGFDNPLPLKKYATRVAAWGNAVQNGELILVAELVASKDSTGNSFERASEEKWFRENGFQQITDVQLYDYSGRVFQNRFTKLSDGMISVDVRDIPQGAYIVRAVYKNERSLTEQEVSTVRIMIER